MEPNTYVRYSEAFKRQVVSELEAGKFNGPHAAMRAYGIRGMTTVIGWLRRYGRADLIPRQLTIKTMKEKDESKALKQRVQQLESALADAHMKGLLNESYLEMACERMGVDVQEFKKKHVTGLSRGAQAKESR